LVVIATRLKTFNAFGDRGGIREDHNSDGISLRSKCLDQLQSIEPVGKRAFADHDIETLCGRLDQTIAAIVRTFRDMRRLFKGLLDDSGSLPVRLNDQDAIDEFAHLSVSSF
jgi:hypothetical protein